MDLDPDTARRLAMLRVLLQRAVAETHSASPYRADSVSRLHDVVEMALALVARHLGVGIPREFDKYWPALEEVGHKVPWQAQMQTLNKVRLSWKHYGAEPSDSEVASAREAVQRLISAEIPAVFGVDLDDVSMTAFVRSDDARRLLERADEWWRDGSHDRSWVDLADAFETMIRDYRQSKVGGGLGTSLLSGVKLPRTDWNDETGKAIADLEAAIVLVGLGIDLRRLGRFRALTPHITRTLGGTVRAHFQPWQTTSNDPDDYAFAVDFVVSSALRLAEVEYEVAREHVGPARIIRTPQSSEQG